MIDRRDFFKKLLLGGVALGTSAPLSFLGGEAYSVEVPQEVIKDYCDKTICCYTKNNKLKYALMEFADEIHCDVEFYAPASEILLWGLHFVSVIDRNAIDEWIWNEYVSGCNESSNHAPCLILDNMTHLAMPRNGYVFPLDNIDSDSINPIKVMIMLTREEQVFNMGEKRGL